MKFFNQIENKLSKYAVKNLSLYLTALYSVGLLINVLDKSLYSTYLMLDPHLILQGQVWRIITWLMYPAAGDVLFSFVMTYLYYVLGTALENKWGSFRYNLFIFSGILAHILAAFIVYAYIGSRFGYIGGIYYVTPMHLNMSIFLAYTLLDPDSVFLLYFVLPVKAKYFSIVYIAMEAYGFWKGSMLERIIILLCLLNVVVFFALSRNWKRIKPDEIRRRYDFKRDAEKPAVKIIPFATKHKCHVCGRTERDGEELEFRYCSKCNGNYEYCQEHLYTHIHIK